MTPQRISISSIGFPQGENALRTHSPEDAKEWEKTLALKDEISYRGMLDSFSVRPVGDDKYEIINGSRRLTVLKMLLEEGHPSVGDGYVTVNVVEMDEYDSLAAQLATNYHMNKTLKGKEIRALQKLALQKGWTMEQTAEHVGMSVVYLTKLMKINTLSDAAQNLVDNGAMSLANAIQLSKLPSDLQDEYLQDAVALTVAELTAKIAQELDELKKLTQKGGQEKQEFDPKPIFIGAANVEVLYNNADAAYQLDPSDYNRGALDVLKAAYSVDEKTLAARKAEWDAAQKVREDKKEARKAELKKAAVEKAKKLLEENGVIVA